MSRACPCTFCTSGPRLADITLSCEQVPTLKGETAGQTARCHVQRREDKTSRLRHIFLQSLANKKASWNSRPQHAGGATPETPASSFSI